MARQENVKADNVTERVIAVDQADDRHVEHGMMSWDVGVSSDRGRLSGDEHS